MSIQIISSCPARFFRESLGVKDAAIVNAFEETIVRETGVVLARRSWRRSVCEDLMPSSMMAILDALHHVGMAGYENDLGGDLCIPSERSIRRSIQFPYSLNKGEPGSMYVVSTSDFRNAISMARPILQKVDDNERLDLMGHLDCFQSVIEISDSRRWPIFWSF